MQFEREYQIITEGQRNAEYVEGHLTRLRLHLVPFFGDRGLSEITPGTYICLRLMEGADIYQIAKNCRTSVEMIEKYYASHLKNSLDAAAINIRSPKTKKKNEPRTEQEE